MPDLRFEAEAAAHGACRVVGVDEVGRGPLAGPVVAAAVWLPPTGFPAGLDDSKRLNAVRRAALATALRAVADVGVGHASVAEIDDLDILRASHLAMCRAVSALAVPPDHALIDGNLLPDGLACSGRSVVRGDACSLSIAAASILAKVARDAEMARLARECPGYGWERNAGYPTAEHRAALLRLGVSRHHRRSFRPVHNILCGAPSLTT